MSDTFDFKRGFKMDFARLIDALRDKPLSRREAMRLGLFTTAGVLAASRLGFESLAQGATVGTADSAAPFVAPANPAKAIIQVWLWGGPSHLDTFDPKPAAGYDYCGPLSKPIATNVDGIIIGELLPLLAKQADKYSIIRSMTHGLFAHETAAYVTQTGRMPGGRDVYPSMGAVVDLFRGSEAAGYKGLVPPYIVLTEPQGRFSESGFLGIRYKPFATGGDPGQPRFTVEGVVAQGITDKRQRDRRDLRAQLDTLGGAMKDDAQMQSAAGAREQAYDLILGDAGKVFDLSLEKDDLRDRYGRTTFGQSCLAARRLVERGVPYVTINYRGWDTHKQHFQAMRQKLPELDKGLSTLLQDLSDRGMLDTTIVWTSGEFGRTPKVLWDPPWNGGRGHYGAVFSSVIAGGGFKGGRVVGASDAKGEEVKDRPVYPADLLGAMYERMGIDPAARLPHPQGKTVCVSPTPDEGVKRGGRLTEIL